MAGGIGIVNLALPAIIDRGLSLSRITVSMIASTYSIISLIGKTAVSITPACTVPASTYIEYINLFDGYNNVPNGMSVTVTTN